MEWRDFDSQDWLAFSGAENFPSTEAPQITDLTVNGREAQAILDRDRLEIWTTDADDTDVQYWAPMPDAARIAVRLFENETAEGLVKLGMERA